MGFALIVLATENDHKLKEFRSLWKWKFPLVSLTEARFSDKMPDETYLSYEGNAVQKAEFVGARLNMVVVGDDSGFEVDALGGEPGVKSARYANTRDSVIQRREILRVMKGVQNRAARFVCCLAIYDPKKGRAEVAWGFMKGSVALEEVGSDGFGYDPIFIPEGMDLTAAQLTSEQKNSISHRALALKALGEIYDFRHFE